MSEYLWIPEQQVLLNQAAIFDAAVPCLNGAIDHENGSGVFTLQGIVFNPYQQGVEYSILVTGNIAVPTGGTAGPIAVGIAVNGEARPASVAISTPTAVNAFNPVTCLATIFVPRGRTYNVSLRAVAPPTDLTATPAPSISLRNANIRFSGRVI